MLNDFCELHVTSALPGRRPVSRHSDHSRSQSSVFLLPSSVVSSSLTLSPVISLYRCFDSKTHHMLGMRTFDEPLPLHHCQLAVPIAFDSRAKRQNILILATHKYFRFAVVSPKGQRDGPAFQTRPDQDNSKYKCNNNCKCNCNNCCQPPQCRMQFAYFTCERNSLPRHMAHGAATMRFPCVAMYRDVYQSQSLHHVQALMTSRCLCTDTL